MVMPKPDSPSTLSLSGFLHMLFGGIEEGYIYAPSLNRETEQFSQAFVKVTSLARLESYIREQSASGVEIYLSPAVWSEPKLNKETFKTSKVLWTEFDGHLPKFDVTPSVVIQSSFPEHQHVYWLMDEPIDDAFVLEQANRAIAHTLGADQSAFDCTQILRPPETFNYKRDKPVVMVSSGLDIHNLGDFASYKAPDRLAEDAIHLGHVPDVMDVIYEYPLGVEFKNVFTAKPEEGQRSTYLMRIAYMAAEAGCTNEEIYSLIRNFDDKVGKYKDREDRHRRLLDIIERARFKYPISTGPDPDDGAVDILDIISFGNQTLEVNWLLPGLLQEQGSMLLVGPPGVGKTQVALNFGYGLATGTPLLGYEMETPRRILFVSAEMGPLDLKVFTDQMTARFSPEQQALLSENFLVYPTGEAMYLNTKEEQDKLRRIIDVYKIDGFIFDSLGSATNKALTDEESTKALLDFNDTLRKDMGVFSWFIHHNRKATENNKEPSGLADVYGSQYITARATSVLSLWPVKANVLKVRELKVRLAASKEDWYIKRSEGLKFTHAEEADIATVIASTKRDVFKRGGESSGKGGFIKP